MSINSANAKAIEQELDWFQKLIMLRGKITFEQSLPEEEIRNLKLPAFKNPDSSYASLVKKHSMSMEERLVLILALIPHVKPSLLDLLHMKNALYDIPFTEFGGIRYDKNKGYLPTGETAIFLLAGTNLEKRFELLRLFSKDHFFQKEGILFLEKSSLNEPQLNGLLSISQEYLSLFTAGVLYKPDFSPDFPAKRIHTTQEWDDLVVSDDILLRLEEIKDYVFYGKNLKNDYQFGRKIKPGFKVLFTGPPGTGKTLTASLLGKYCKMDVYRVDLSMVVSKYIGETEKNLSRVFDMAESKNWILFFDEADALFGKRSNTSDSHDRYANQEVSFLLQRMEDFDGLVILCSNFKKNIDEAFFRRFQLVLDFEIPDAHLRHILWEKSKTAEFEYDKDVDLEYLAEQHEISAASIINVLHYSILKCLGKNDRIIRMKDIQAGLKMEKIKEGKSIV
jgi:ATPase family associated with various cellular activities (AAA)